MLQLMLSTRNLGFMGDERGKNIHDSSPFYATYRCADSGFITLGSIEPQFYSLLLEKLGPQEDSRFVWQWDRLFWKAQHQHFTEMFAGRSRALYMSCWVVIRYQADFKARYDALGERGKSAKVALIACMRILLIRLNAMLRDGTEWC